MKIPFSICLQNNNVYEKLSLLWKFVKPISFALIGKEVNFSKLDSKILAYGLVIIVAGSIVSKNLLTTQLSCSVMFHKLTNILQIRMILSYVSAFGAELNWKEQLYVTISGFPKATVQAALGPVALDQIHMHDIDPFSYEAQMANIVLIISVLAIVLTAPLGAVLMVKLAPKFLQKSQLPPR